MVLHFFFSYSVDIFACNIKCFKNNLLFHTFSNSSWRGHFHPRPSFSNCSLYFSCSWLRISSLCMPLLQIFFLISSDSSVARLGSSSFLLILVFVGLLFLLEIHWNFYFYLERQEICCNFLLSSSQRHSFIVTTYCASVRHR